MTQLDFSKYEGLGNDFIVVYEQELSSEQVRKLCDRHFGVGADGVIVLARSDRADFRFDLYNADGGAAEVSGNGMRCAGRYLYEKGYHADTVMKIEAAGEIKVVELVKGREDLSVRVDMGIPTEEGEVELHGRVWKKISTGNPHAVTFVDDIDSAPVEQLGPVVEHDSEFPNRTNVHFIKVEGDVVHARFWERGVGVTLACGTGSCASVVASGLPRATVRTLGGDLLVEREPDGRTFLTGPASHVFDGRLA